MPLEPDWKALAQMAGEEVDEAAWEEYARSTINDPRRKRRGILAFVPRVRRKRRGMRPEAIQRGWGT